MSIPRFYISPDEYDLARLVEMDLQKSDPKLMTLSAIESQHATVLRLKPGDQVELFDGLGNCASGEVANTSKRETQIKADTCLFSPKELPGKLVVITALPKADRQKALVEKTVELGVHKLITIASERAVVKANEKSLMRLRRYAIESCKQCGRNRIPGFAAFSSLEELLNKHTSTIDLENACGSDSSQTVEPDQVIRWLAHPYLGNQRAGQASGGFDRKASNPFIDERHFPNTRIEIMVGPEGGFSDSEVRLLLQRGWRLLQLGPRILRVETAISRSVSIASELLEPSCVY